ncbi:cobalamin B12-binding domain-containing protein [Streptomyces sp. PR69]|uniref:cobalamin B12-binding domain-containing protein n=1 Tax=Streptomyces sp. PR69 TaxID=2984950 RepID=UPI002265467A|nr:cobalamin-dependent protein [Streptomyces sp. PR69]
MSSPAPSQDARPAARATARPPSRPHAGPHAGRATGQRVLVSSVSSDSHTWNLVFLQLLLEELGNEVINVGACVPDDLLIAECRRTSPDMVVISSVNGHGHLDGRRLIGRLRAEPDLAGLPVVIGGKLGTRGAENAAHGPELMAAGFDAVFEDSAGIAPFREFLEARTPAALTAGGAA